MVLGLCLQKQITHMQKLDALLYNKLIQNIVVWSCLGFLVFVVMNDGEDGNDMIEAFISFTLTAIAIYVNNLLILPYFNTKKLFFFFLFFLNIVVLSLVTIFLIIDEPTVAIFFKFFGNSFLSISFGVSLKIARDSFVRKQKGKEAELQLLKAQLNPHFLFNTLNNLYGLAVLKSDKLPGLMLQLSDLLRYSLYETKEVFVPLTKELNYLESYIALEKIRLEAQTDIKFTFVGAIAEKEIAPMLFIVFVENAFKHLGSTKDKKSSVNIRVEVLDNGLFFCCENTFDASKLSEQNLEKGKSGIGLVNAKKRLRLLYSNTHLLSIKEEEEFFKIQLTLAI